MRACCDRASDHSDARAAWTFLKPTAKQVVTASHDFGVGDFDGNGSTDIFWRDNNTGTVAPAGR